MMMQNLNDVILFLTFEIIVLYIKPEVLTFIIISGQLRRYFFAVVCILFSGYKQLDGSVKSILLFIAVAIRKTRF